MTIRAAWFDRDYVRTSYGNVLPAPPHRALFDAGSRLHSEQGEYRRTRADAAMFLYFGNRRRGLYGSRFFGDLLGEEPSFRNVVQMAVDTRTAHVVRNKVRILFDTDRGDTDAQQKALAMTRAVEAIFTSEGIYGQKGMLVCQDGSLFDAGMAKVVPDFANSRVVIDRVFPWEVYVPEEESRYGEPRQMLHRQPVDRRVLLALYPEHEEAIRQAPVCPDDWRYTTYAFTGDTSDLVAVWEGWHRPSGRVDLEDPASFGVGDDGELDPSLDPGHDGRHVVAIENATLSDRPWPFDYFPIASFRPNPDPMGYWSRSIPETLAGEQLELIKLGRRMGALVHLHAVPRIVVSRSAKLNKQAISNDYATILDCNGSPENAIQYLQPHAVPSELFQREQSIVDAAMNKVGLSELTAYAQKPAGVDHAPGMQMLLDTESIRHTPAFRSWEDFHLDLGRAVVDAVRMLAEADPDFEILWGDDRQLQKIRWRDVDLERSKYRIKKWPTNLLPQMPAARASMIAQLSQSGALPEPMATKAMLENPDIKALLGDTTAEQENVDRHIERILKDGYSEATAPHPFMNLALCKTSSASRINRLEADGVSDGKVEGLRRFWADADELEKRAKNEAVQASQGELPPGGPPGPGGGVPSAPPGAAAPPGAPPMAA